jgi:hypothetical protein
LSVVDRLVGWYQVGSSYAAVAALLISNAIPLIGVLFLGWNVWTILIIYWLENGVVGFFNVLKMRRAQGEFLGGAAAVEVNGRPFLGPLKAVLIPFFILHYGLFWLVHGVFVLTLPGFLPLRSLGADGSVVGVGSSITTDPLAVAFVVIGLFISHGVSYRFNYIGRGEYLRASAIGQMFAPYGRLVILHITIIIGAMAIALTGAPSAAVVVLVALKTALDLRLHLAAHRDAPSVTMPLAPEPDAAAIR